MKCITIFDLLQMYINKEPMPKRIKYGLMREGYEYFRWEDYDCFEYVNEGDGNCFLSDTPWHHYMDEVEIVDEPQTEDLIKQADDLIAFEKELLKTELDKDANVRSKEPYFVTESGCEFYVKE